METKLVQLLGKESDLNKALYEAAKVLKEGGLVAFPTETVYGLGGNALEASIVKKIYKAKGRPQDNPLIVHLAHAEQVGDYVQYIPEIGHRLMAAFWPGPLTLIFNKNKCLPDTITGGLETVGIRVPDHPVALALLELTNLPIAAPSANLSGKPSPTNATHVLEDLNGRIDMVIDGGQVSIGLESTVLDLTTLVPIILRPGEITRKQIEALIGKIKVSGERNISVPKAPGMKYKHYAPEGELVIVSGAREQAINQINQRTKKGLSKGKKVGIISTVEAQHLYEHDLVMVIGSENKPKEIAANLFRILRAMDKEGVDYIYTRPFKEEAIGVATMNRLLKAGERWQP